MTSTHYGRNVLTHGGAVHLTSLNKNTTDATANAFKGDGSNSVVLTDCSDDESELRSIARSQEMKPNEVEGLKGIRGLPTNGNVQAKWKAAGKQVQRVVNVTQAFNRPAESRQEKVRRQLYGSKAALPVLPVPSAISLLILNILLPGAGTIVAGFTFFCCATTYDKPDRKGIWEKLPGLFCTNIFVGLAQLVTVTFLLVGWFWSVAWGVTMVQLAKERRKEISENSS